MSPINGTAPLVFIPIIPLSGSIPVLVQEWEAGKKERFRAVTLWSRRPDAWSILAPSRGGPSFESMYHEPLRTRREGWMMPVSLLAAAPLPALAKIASGALLGMNRAWWVLGFNLGWGATVLAVKDDSFQLAER